MPVIEGTTRLKEASGEYDFAVDGGAVSTITLRAAGGSSLGGIVPAGSVILGGFIEVDTIVTTASGNTGTIAVNSEAAGDLLAAAITSGAPWSSTGRKAILPVFTAGSSVKTTVARSLAVTVAVAAVTAGKFRVVVYYR